MSRPSQKTLQQRLADGVVVGAEGYVFELERRGYIKAGPFVPEVILDEPDALRQLHREFLRAGSDVMVALTYYAHRDKLRDVGRADDLEAMNRQAVRIANEIAAEGGALVAGNICNTWSYDPELTRCASGAVVRAQYEEQLGWAAEEGVDFVIARDQRLRRRGPHRPRGLPGARPAGDGHVRERAAEHDLRRLRLRQGVPDPRRARRGGSSASTARAARRRCCRCSSRSARRSTSRWRRSPCPTARRRRRPAFEALESERPAPVPARARAVPVHALRDGGVRAPGPRRRRELHRHLLRRRAAPRPGDGRGARARHPGQPVLPGHRAPSRARDPARRR